MGWAKLPYFFPWSDASTQGYGVSEISSWSGMMLLTFCDHHLQRLLDHQGALSYLINLSHTLCEKSDSFLKQEEAAGN